MENFEKKIHLEIIKAIDGVETQNKEEILMKMEYIMNISKILENYENLRPIFNKYFNGERGNKNAKQTR